MKNTTYFQFKKKYYYLTMKNLFSKHGLTILIALLVGYFLYNTFVIMPRYNQLAIDNMQCEMQRDVCLILKP